MNKSEWIKRIMVMCNFMILTVALTACASSKAGKKEKCCLKVIVFDDKQKPVNEFNLLCRHKETGMEFKGTTDLRGFLYFDDAYLGDYEISGTKDGYGIIENKAFSFTNESSVVFCQVQGIVSLFEKIEKAFFNKEYKKGLSCFDEVYIEKNGSVHGAQCYYRASAFFYMNEYEKALEEISLLRQMNCSGFEEPCKRLEKIIYERMKEEVDEVEEITE